MKMILKEDDKIYTSYHTFDTVENEIDYKTTNVTLFHYLKK